MSFQPYRTRRSCNNSYKKRATQFKKGSRQLTDNVVEHEIEPEPTPSTSGCNAPKRCRLTSQEAVDLANISTSPDLPYTLRPKHVTDECPGIENTKMKENVIVNMRKVTELINHVHRFTCKKSRVSVDVVNRTGLCVSFAMKCSSCRFRLEPFQMSDTVKKAKGPPAGALNEMAVLPAIKTKVGLADITTVLICLNIKAPSKKAMQLQFNAMCDKMTALNERQMGLNQEYLQHVTSLVPTNMGIDVQYDASYSSRPQGGCEKAEQSFAPLIEHSTTRKLPIAVRVANKHCRLKACDHNNAKCKKNYSSVDTIAASERSLLFDTLNDVRKRGHITLRSVTTDASQQLSRALKDFKANTNSNISHQVCFIHRGRTLQKHIRALKLTSIPTCYDKRMYQQKLASCIRIRIRMELKKARAVTKSDESFVLAGSRATGIIMKCLSAQHRLCREFSYVCRSHLASYTTSHLPFGVHLKLR